VYTKVDLPGDIGATIDSLPKDAKKMTIDGIVY